MIGTATDTVDLGATHVRRPLLQNLLCWLVVVAAGLAVGAATSILQGSLDAPWSSLVNAASPWLCAAFAVGTLWRRPTTATVAGFVACALELVGYYATAHVRGYASSHAILVFWGACALVGGPVFGAAGWAWWRGTQRLSGLGASVLAAAFLAEAAVSYGWRLHYRSSAILFAALGATLAVLLGLRHHEHRSIATWLPLTLATGLLAELLLGLVYQQTL